MKKYGDKFSLIVTSLIFMGFNYFILNKFLCQRSLRIVSKVCIFAHIWRKKHSKKTIGLLILQGLSLLNRGFFCLNFIFEIQEGLLLALLTQHNKQLLQLVGGFGVDEAGGL